MDDGAEFLDRRRFKTSLTREEAATDRAALLDEAILSARESGRPVLWYVYKVVETTKRGRQMIRAPILDLAMRQVVWSDPDVERIVTASFTPLRMVCDEALCERFKLRPLQFLEPAVLFIAPDGQVIHRVDNIRTIRAPWFRDVLRDVLDKLRGPLPASATRQQALDRGDYGRVLNMLPEAGHQTATDLYVRATMLRRLRKGAEALTAVEAARAAWQQAADEKKKSLSEREARRFDRMLRSGRFPELADLRGKLAAEEGLVLARMGRFHEAMTPLQTAADVPGPRSGEAAYLLARIRAQTGDEAGASRRFQKLAQDEPDTVWGRRARANVLVGIDDGRPIGAAFSGVARLQWLPAAGYARLPSDTAWPGASRPVRDTIDSSVRFLLEQQRDDGGWNDARYAYCPDKRITPNVWVAVSSLACNALLRHRDRVTAELRDEIDDALRRGERYILDPMHLNRGKNEDVYADAYRLLFLAARHAAAEAESDRRRLRLHMRGIIKDAELRQKTDGFWAHEYGNAFCTAAMVQGLMAAREAGVQVTEAVLRGAREALTAARFEDGSFSYGGIARGAPRDDGLKNASTRMPLCETALLSLGASDGERVGHAFRTFRRFYDRIEGVRRTDFHSDGQIAGFMFFHTLFHTSLAISSLPADERGPAHRHLLDRIITYPEMDGTFMDSHEVGRSYGSAMALLVIAKALDTTP